MSNSIFYSIFKRASPEPPKPRCFALALMTDVGKFMKKCWLGLASCDGESTDYTKIYLGLFAFVCILVLFELFVWKKQVVRKVARNGIFGFQLKSMSIHHMDLSKDISYSGQKRTLSAQTTLSLKEKHCYMCVSKEEMPPPSPLPMPLALPLALPMALPMPLAMPLPMPKPMPMPIPSLEEDPTSEEYESEPHLSDSTLKSYARDMFDLSQMYDSESESNSYYYHHHQKSQKKKKKKKDSRIPIIVRPNSKQLKMPRIKKRRPY